MTITPKLVAVGGPTNGAEYLLEKDDFSLGRDVGNSLMVAWDVSISRQHAHIYRQSGLYWLQDLNSSNGTYLSLKGGDERKLAPQESVLLLDGAQVRIGRNAHFRIEGLIRNEDEALQLLMGHLQQVMGDVYAGLSYIDPAERERQCAWLRDFENRLKAAKDENDLYRVASEGTQTLIGTFRGELPAGQELPPLPDDLPDPNAPGRLNSILNYFIDDIRDCFPEDKDRDDRAH